MLGLTHIWEPRYRNRALLISAGATLVIAIFDWLIKTYISLGFFYLFPIMLAAGFLPRPAIVIFGTGCAILAELFSTLPISRVRLAFEALALSGCGLFIAELERNRRLNRESEQALEALVETSPAAIITVNQHGFIELANRAAHDLLAPRDALLAGAPVAAFLPELHYALRWEDAPQFRASMQCHVHRGNGEIFLAEVWFSTYRHSSEPKLAAILVETTEPPEAGDAEQQSGNRPALTEREVEVLRLLVQGFSNKEIGAHMNLSESSVKNALQQIFSKTSVRTRAQVVRIALERYRDLL